MSTLIIQTGKHKGRKIPLPEEDAIIGRDEGCFIRITSTDVSRQHCVFVHTPKGLLVRDLGSQNGTIVNNAIIEGETLLQPGDYIQIGSMQFQLAGARTTKPKPKLDDTIAEWLSESDTSVVTAQASDTTILKKDDWHPIPAQAPAAAHPPSAPHPTTHVHNLPHARHVFHTVADEAQDIIRRHLASLS